MNVTFPPLTEQQRIVDEVERRMSVIEQMEHLVETNLKRAESLRQSILRLAFSGRLVNTATGDIPTDPIGLAIRNFGQSLHP